MLEVVTYEAGWPQKFKSERALLEVVLAPWLMGGIEHIGSTAVPGLAAKPVIDIMAPVISLEESQPAIKAVAAVGYVFYPYKPDVMYWFCKPSPEVRTHHLHLVPMGSELWRARLHFRDALRADARLAAQYAALKTALARAHTDRDAYTDAKGPFIRQVLATLPPPATSEVLRSADATEGRPP